MIKLAVGDSAPDFTLPDATEHPVSLADYAGRRVIVYFYPAAMTPGCTTQAVDFTAARDDFTAAGYAIIGISPDSPDQLAKFVLKKDLTVTLLGDPGHTVIDAYGAWGTKTLYGKSLEGVLRSTFALNVNAEGRATVTYAAYNVRASGHVDKLRRELGVPTTR